MKIRHLAVGLAALVLPVAIGACASPDSSELDREELVAELEQAGLPSDEADCAADALIDAGLTADELEELASDGSLDDEDKADAFTEAITACVGTGDDGSGDGTTTTEADDGGSSDGGGG